MELVGASLIACCLLLAKPVHSVNPRITTTSGPVQGIRVTGLHRLLDSFLGIPYAQPPLGDLRFRSPEPIQPWTHTLIANRFSAPCYHKERPNVDHSDVSNPTEHSEDCLYLNIWAPYLKNEQTKLATILWVNDGSSGHEHGSGNYDVFDGKYLASENDVIVVSVNYRVGVLGYLYVGNERAPGNMALLDQAMALTWIYNNIGNFGGDNRKITLFGDGRGAESVSLHLLSRVSRTYFTNAILQRGTFFGPRSYLTPTEAMKYTERFVSAVGCSNGNTDEMMECLNSTEIDKIMRYQGNVDENHTTIFAGPTLDGYFLEDSPHNLIDKGQIKSANIIAGVNSQEHSGHFVRSANNYFVKRGSSLPSDLYLSHGVEGLVPVHSEVARYAILHEYKLSVLPSRQQGNIDILDDIATDYNVLCPTMDFAQAYATVADSESVYVFSFDHKSTRTQQKNQYSADLLQFVLGMPFTSRNYTDAEKILSSEIMSFWTNFAKTGNPNKENRYERRPDKWPAYAADDERYIILKTGHSFAIEQGLRYARCSFWRDLFPELNNVKDAECSGSYAPASTLIALLSLFVSHYFN